ncbi:hypothetical protein C8Q77DRAFT_863442 [Trametes polyzona]|nr:hypothetical protein C8Q77DRAFT_863442 [Trametes polyzona]
MSSFPKRKDRCLPERRPARRHRLAHEAARLTPACWDGTEAKRGREDVAPLAFEKPGLPASFARTRTAIEASSREYCTCLPARRSKRAPPRSSCPSPCSFAAFSTRRRLAITSRSVDVARTSRCERSRMPWQPSKWVVSKPRVKSDRHPRGRARHYAMVRRVYGGPAPSSSGRCRIRKGRTPRQRRRLIRTVRLWTASREPRCIQRYQLRPRRLLLARRLSSIVKGSEEALSVEGDVAGRVVFATRFRKVGAWERS